MYMTLSKCYQNDRRTGQQIPYYSEMTYLDHLKCLRWLRICVHGEKWFTHKEFLRYSRNGIPIAYEEPPRTNKGGFGAPDMTFSGNTRGTSSAQPDASTSREPPRASKDRSTTPRPRHNR